MKERLNNLVTDLDCMNQMNNKGVYGLAAYLYMQLILFFFDHKLIYYLTEALNSLFVRYGRI
jgi:hypothetical protein